MTTADFSVFFALLALACWGGTALVLALVIATRAGSSPSLAQRLDELCEFGLWLAWIVALVTTLGSLYYSEIAHFTPCKLCWYQRIAMYPLAFTLLAAALRRDRRVVWYVVPVALVGTGFSIYHTQLQAFPHQHSSFCTTTEPCTVRSVWEFGFVSLPFMALSAFVFIITMTTVAAWRAPRAATT